MSEIPHESEWPANYVPRKLMETRIAERATEQAAVIRGLKDELKTAQTQAAAYPTLRAEYDAYKATIELESAYRGVAMSLDGVGDEDRPIVERKRARLRLMWEADNATAESKLTFGDWLTGPALEDPVASMLLPSSAPADNGGTPGVAGAEDGSPAQPAAPRGTPATSTGARPVAKVEPRTPEQIKAAAAALSKEGKHAEARQMLRDAANGT